MLGLYLENEFLDLFEDVRVTFRRNNDIYTTGDPTLLTGSYSFPFDVPLTTKNRRMLRYPDRIDNFYTLLADIPVYFYAGEGASIGLPLFEGRLYVKSAAPDRASVFMIVEGLSNLKDRTFEDIDLGHLAFDTQQDIVTHANDTLDNPLDHTHAFPPVYNPVFIDSGVMEIYIRDPITQVPAVQYTNLYDRAQQSIIDDIYGGPAVISPYLRVDWILDQIVQSFGYSIDNRLQNTDEMKSLLLYNNYNIHGDVIGTADQGLFIGGWRTRIDFNNHVPAKINLVEFLKLIAKTFFCGIFVDTSLRQISIIPMAHLIDQPHQHDWTDKTFPDYNIEQDNHTPLYVGYATDPDDQLFSTNTWRDTDQFPTITPWDELDNPTDPGFYYFRASDMYRQIQGPTSVQTIQFFERIYLRNAKGDPFESRAIPAFMVGSVPQIYMRGTGANRSIEEVESFFGVMQRQELRSVRLFFYRGKITIPDAGPAFPYSNNSAWDPVTQEYDYDTSLLWQGPNGIYERYAREWIYFMENKKIVKRRIKLTLPDLLNLRDYDKVHIDGQYFFVKSLSLSFSHAGMDPAEAELASIPQT
jgi:hypothetical protein